MKPPWIVLLPVVAICGLAAGVTWHFALNRTALLESKLANLKTENAKLAGQLANATEKAQALEAESAQLRAARAMAGTRLEAPPVAEETPNEKGGFLSKMLKDPQMRKIMAAGESAALRRLYSDYIRQAHLTPDETDRFYRLLEDRQEGLMDSSANMISGGAVDMKAAAAAANTANDALKELLGSDRFSQYVEFEKTLGSRVQAQQFNQQLAGDGVPLQDDQREALLTIMSEENAKMTPSGGGGAPNGLGMNPADIDQFSKQVEETNQRIYNRAMAVLSPQQLSAFAIFQKNMETEQIEGRKMAQQMLKGNQ